MSKSKLKKCLLNLKIQCGKLEEIRYVRKKLRYQNQTRDYEGELNKDFWKFCKGEFERQPNFDEWACYNYFKSILLEKSKNRSFTIHSWLK